MIIALIIAQSVGIALAALFLFGMATLGEFTQRGAPWPSAVLWSIRALFAWAGLSCVAAAGMVLKFVN